MHDNGEEEHQRQFSNIPPKTSHTANKGGSLNAGVVTSHAKRERGTEQEVG